MYESFVPRGVLTQTNIVNDCIGGECRYIARPTALFGAYIFQSGLVRRNIVVFPKWRGERGFCDHMIVDGEELEERSKF